MHNPVVYNYTELQLMSARDVLVAQYQLQLATTSLFYAVLLFTAVFFALRWFLPKWYAKGRR